MFALYILTYLLTHSYTNIKKFKPNNIDIVKACGEYFSFDLFSVIIIIIIIIEFNSGTIKIELDNTM